MGTSNQCLIYFLCPKYFATTFIVAPLLIKSDAQLCLKSCILICLTYANLRLLEKETECNLKEEQETTIILSLILILENHIINNSEEVKDYKVELQNKEILRNLNQLFNIRENYENRLNMR